MPLSIVKDDITKLRCDAIVNPTNEDLIADGGTDLAIHKAAGPRLEQACRTLGKLKTGDAKITPAFDLPCKYVIHTVGPVWQGGDKGERELLIDCYKNSLKLAIENGCEAIAFPLISSGVYGYPKDKVLKIATETISSVLEKHELTVYLVVYNKDAFQIDKELYLSICDFIEQSQRDAFEGDSLEDTDKKAPHTPRQKRGEGERDSLRQRRLRASHTAPPNRDFSIGSSTDDCSIFEEDDDFFESFICRKVDSERLKDTSTQDSDPLKSIEAMIRHMDKGFAHTLFHFIDQKGISDVDCYKRANVDKKTFSKIKCNKDYRPSKITVVSFAIGLRLNREETAHLLNTAGFSLSKSNRFDIIIEYFVTSGNYKTIYDVNEVLYQFDQTLLGV